MAARMALRPALPFLRSLQGLVTTLGTDAFRALVRFSGRSQNMRFCWWKLIKKKGFQDP